jgi:hypothetical protein
MVVSKIENYFEERRRKDSETDVRDIYKLNSDIYD